MASTMNPMVYVRNQDDAQVPGQENPPGPTREPTQLMNFPFQAGEPNRTLHG